MKIVVGVTASIAAYKTCELVRQYRKAGHDLFVVMSKNATKLVRPLTFENIAGNPVYTAMFSHKQRDMAHITLREDAGLFIIAPATANCIAKIAHGIADDLLSTTVLAMQCPLVIAPAMNPAMWRNQAVQHNLEIVRSRGITVVEPESGVVACGDSGKGKMAHVDTIYKTTAHLI